MTLNDLENTMVVQMRNQQLYLVITDCLPPNASKNKDIVFLSQGGYMQGTSYTFNMLMNTDDGFAINLDAVAYFNDEFVRFVNDWKMEISTKTYHLLRDYVHCKSKEVELKLNAPNQTESRTY